MNLLDVLRGKKWSIQHAIQTTYPFDPQFYSQYVRPRLQNRNCDLPLILIDGGRYEREITSSDWREAPIGTDYLLEPVNLSGVFHPKINLFASEQSVFYSVSSANLTLAEYCQAAQIGYADGFQKSWITDDDRDVGEAYWLARDIRDFYTELADHETRITGEDATTYISETATTLEWLDDVAAEVSSTEEERTTQFVSNLSRPIVSQVLDMVGEVESATLYAPYYGTPNVLQRIASKLDADHIDLVVEPESTALDIAGLGDALDGTDYAIRKMDPRHATRWVHAKFLLVEGDWGTACLYGSPNMTSSALLDNAVSGNVEAALLTIVPPESAIDLEDAVFDSASFAFDIGDPVEDPSTLNLRDASYEGWESLQHDSHEEIQLTDAQLTQPGSEGESELILRITGVTGEHEFRVQTIDGTARTVSAAIDAENAELSVYIPENERDAWQDAVVTVAVDGATSNPRRVVEEMQAYYREYREIKRSAGTQSSNTLLRSILQNPDTTAVSVFDVALSELQQAARAGVTEAHSSDKKDDEAGGRDEETFPERGPSNLTTGGSSLPSLHSLVEQHLSYHREQALAALELADQPLPENLTNLQEHAEVFCETIELCFVLDQLGQLDSERINTGRLFSTCEAQLDKWFEQLGVLVQRLNGVINQVENNDAVRDAFRGNTDKDVSELDCWHSVFEVLILHPGIVLEFEATSEYSVIDSKNLFANALLNICDAVHPHIGQYLRRGQTLAEQSQTVLDDLTVEFNTGDQDITLSGDGIRALVLFVLIQKIEDDTTFIQELKDDSRCSSADITELAQFASRGEEAIVQYGLMNDLTWSIVLTDARQELEALQNTA